MGSKEGKAGLQCGAQFCRFASVCPLHLPFRTATLAPGGGRRPLRALQRLKLQGVPRSRAELSRSILILI